MWFLKAYLLPAVCIVGAVTKAAVFSRLLVHFSFFCFSFIWRLVHFLDVDECALGRHKCGANTICTNNKGSYSCTCNRPGYHGDAENCEPGEFCKVLSRVNYNIHSLDFNKWLFYFQKRKQKTHNKTITTTDNTNNNSNNEALIHERQVG